MLAILSVVLLTSSVMSFVSFKQERNNRINIEQKLISMQSDLDKLKQSNTELNQQLETKNKESSTQSDSLDNIHKELDKINKEKETLIQEKVNLEKENQNLANKIVQQTETSPPITQTPVARGEKIAYLTFDDGPSENTNKIMDILSKYNIKATFFVNGNKPEIFKRIVEEGHAIGNHTYSHDYASLYTSVENFKNDFQKNEDLIFKETGIRPKIMRFPGGSNNTVSYKYGGKGIMKEIADEMTKEGYVFFDWNIDSQDASKVTQDKNVIINSVLNTSKNKNVIVVLMHSSLPKTTTVEALPSIIEGLQKRGYKFEVLDEKSYAPQFIYR